jgi:predicted MFS family arabinose efflux permease
VVIAAAVAVVVAALLDAPHRGWTDPFTLGRLVAGITLCGLFVAIERRLPNPLVDVRLFADPRFTAAAATVTALFAATFAFFFLAMQYLQLILGYSALVTAIAFAPFVVPVVGLSALSVRYTPRIGQHRVLPVGLVVIGCGFLSMLALERDSSYQMVALCIVVIGAGIGLCTAPATTAIMSAIGEDRQGIGSAINDAAREIGAALGFALAGSVLADRYTGSITPRLADWPAQIRVPASDSLGAALHLAHLAGPQGGRLAELGMDSFVSAMHTSAVVMAATALVAAVFVGWRSPRDSAR